MPKPRLVSLYTFLAVFVVLIAVGAVALPVIVSYVERGYFRLPSDVNRRQALAMSRFVQNRLASGVSRAEARAVLAAIVLALAIQMTLFARKGFVKLLGASHAPWILLLPWLATRLPASPMTSAFGTWLVLLLAVNGLSLVIDAVDVARYWRGETEPSYVLPPPTGVRASP